MTHWRRRGQLFSLELLWKWLREDVVMTVLCWDCLFYWWLFRKLFYELTCYWLCYDSVNKSVMLVSEVQKGLRKNHFMNNIHTNFDDLWSLINIKKIYKLFSDFPTVTLWFTSSTVYTSQFQTSQENFTLEILSHFIDLIEQPTTITPLHLEIN